MVYDLSETKIIYREIYSPDDTSITIVIPGTPISKQRHRTVRTSRTVHSYDPQERNKKHIKNIMQNHMTFHKKVLLPSTATYYVAFTFSFPVPKSLSKKKAEIYYSGGYEYMIKSDIDNCIKMYLDAANSILYHDDRQISQITALKKYARTPTTIMTLTPINSC